MFYYTEALTPNCFKNIDLTLFSHRKSLPNVKELEPGVEEAAEQVLKLREYQDVNVRIRP